MRIQITCPNCRSSYFAEVHQLVDVGQQPQLKQLLLSGQLNVAVCQNCGMGGSIATPLFYHDPTHELFMLFVPQEANISQMQREQLIGQVTQQIMKSLPMEQRKAYLFQPLTMLNMQSFMEKVLETEGVTREMIDRQKKQSELLRTLATADKDVADYLIKQRIKEIDETFFAMLQQLIDAASQSNDNKQVIPLLNLKARLMVETPVGRQLERQQIAIHAFSREAKKQGGLTPELLFKHVLLNQNDEHIVQALVTSGQSALSYEFFQLLTNEIEKVQASGDAATAKNLTQLRDDLLEYYDALRQQSQEIMERANETLNLIMRAEDKEAAIQEHAERIDEFFMYFLNATITQAEQKGQPAQAEALRQIQTLIVQEAESQMPPELLLLNQLVEAETEAEQRQILEANKQLLSPNLIKMIEVVEDQAKNSGESELNGRLRSLKAMIQTRL